MSGLTTIPFVGVPARTLRFQGAFLVPLRLLLQTLSWIPFWSCLACNCFGQRFCIWLDLWHWKILLFFGTLFKNISSTSCQLFVLFVTLSWENPQDSFQRIGGPGWERVEPILGEQGKGAAGAGPTSSDSEGVCEVGQQVLWRVAGGRNHRSALQRRHLPVSAQLSKESLDCLDPAPLGWMRK